MKFRPRFRLRTLLLAVAAVAVLCWGYWIGWPSWLVYREQCQFEATFKQLHVGSTTDDMLALQLPDVRGMNWYPLTYQPAWGWFVRGWPNAVYVAVCRIRDPIHPGWLAGLFGESSMDLTRVPFKSVALYRLSPISKDYQPFSARVRHAFPGWAEHLANPKVEKASIYAEDFLDFITGDRKRNPGFKYELIYADPPMKTQD